MAGFRALCSTLPDRRRGKNTMYEIADIGLGAFSTFFMQCPSFLARQRVLERGHGTSNCQCLFGMIKIPTDNHIRSVLDPVSPQAVFPAFGEALAALIAGGGLTYFRRLNGHVLIAFDGTEYFRSQDVWCPNCSSRARANGRIEHFHSMVSAALVAPGHNRVLPLEPEFIAPQDGAEKQDCEARAAQRWLAAHGPKYAHLKPIYLGDDLSSRQPTCEAVLAAGGHFLFTAKPSSHKTLYSWLEGAEVPSTEKKVKQGKYFATYRYRWMEGVPIRDGEDALMVNWLEIEIVDRSGKVTYRNSFITDLPVCKNNVDELVAAGRARWKIENENFNTMKTKGYNLEHNFGHGQQHLAALLAAMNLIAFAFHTVADLVDEAWILARQAIGARKRFFEELRTITAYLVFPTWAALVESLRTATPPPPVIRDG